MPYGQKKKKFKQFLKMGEDHLDWAEIQSALIDQMGLENYLTSQT